MVLCILSLLFVSVLAWYVLLAELLSNLLLRHGNWQSTGGL